MDTSSLQLDPRPKSVGVVLRSSNEPDELSQWPCHDDSTINIVNIIIIVIIIIIIIIIIINNNIRWHR